MQDAPCGEISAERCILRIERPWPQDVKRADASQLQPTAQWTLFERPSETLIINDEW